MLHGLGGCGKTALALEVIDHLQRGLAGIPRRIAWWVDARQGVVLDSGLRALARQAGLSREEASAGWAADALWECLARAPYDWVLVVDNVDDPRVLDGPGRLAAGTGWLRPHAAPSGLILVTTRDGTARTWGPSAKLHSVTPLADGAASEILVDHAGTAAGSLDAARALARRLGGLPLALRMAGSYLAEVNGMPGAFRDPHTPTDFSTYHAALDGPTSARLHPAQAIEETWRLSVDYLHAHGFPYAGPSGSPSSPTTPLSARPSPRCARASTPSPTPSSPPTGTPRAAPSSSRSPTAPRALPPRPPAEDGACRLRAPAPRAARFWDSAAPRRRSSSQWSASY